MLLVDGHNLIGRTPGLSLSREAESREQVLRRISAVKGSGGQRVLVVFDGTRPGAAKQQSFGGLGVVYAPGHSSADAEILRRVSGHHNPRTVTVVTSDRELADRARSMGARCESCEAFWARLHKRRGAPAACEKPETNPGDVEKWLELFAAPHHREGSKH